MDVEKVIEETFGELVKGKTISQDTVIKDLGLDSLDLVESLMKLEEKLNIEFSDDEMLSFHTVRDVYTSINKKLNKQKIFSSREDFLFIKNEFF